MGTSTSKLDSFQSVNDAITSMVYMPPKTTREEIKSLNNRENTKVFRIKNNVCILEIKSVSKSDKTIIFSHGNACDIYTMYDYLKKLSETLNVNVVCYDYCGYGLTKNKKLSEKGCYKCLEKVIAYYVDLGQKILLMGQSLGTGVTIYCATKLNWTNPIILISPYKSLPRVLIDGPVDCLIKNNVFPSLDKIGLLQCPVKIYHGENDNIIPIEHSYYLWNMLKNKSLKPVWLKADHNDILLKIDYLEIENILLDI
jgi:pimeloyl-ACP methyl ester carboxylesterase